MRKYVDQNLLSNEKVIFHTHRHPIVLLQSVPWLILMVCFWFIPDLENISWLFFILFLVTTGLALINYYFSEIAVTNMRVLIKVGLLTVRSLETTLQNIASIEIRQGLIGRFFNYGTVIICDTGMTRSWFQYISEPYMFRKAVYSQIDQRFPTP